MPTNSDVTNCGKANGNLPTIMKIKKQITDV